MTDLRRVGVESEERESFQVTIVGNATFIFSLPSLSDADGGLRRLKLPGCRPPPALLSFTSQQASSVRAGDDLLALNATIICFFPI